MPIAVAAFYKFTKVENPASLRDRLRDEMIARDMKGTILVAPEGINGTVSALPEAMDGFLAVLRACPQFAGLVVKLAMTDTHPFKRLKVKLKPEILTFGQPEADPAVRVGTYVAPDKWNALISDPDVLVLDTRNRYEVEVGTFAGAVDPNTRNFRQFPEFVHNTLDPVRHNKVAMFCTGGIRCEKASAYMLAHGFSEVYHLEGGILNYLANVPKEESLWQGECFVFDERGGVE